MNATEFYRDGRPSAGVITRDTLLDPRSKKHFKYKTAIQEDKLGAAAIFELSDAPCIYFKCLADAAPSDQTLTAIRRLAWNHGLAPLLWVVTPTAVLIYNCYSKPRSDDEREHEHHLIRTFDDIATDLKSLNNFGGRLQLESGAFWRRNEARRIDRRQRVDTSLLQDLTDAEERLFAENLGVAAAHALLGRCIFVAYLQDRGILKPQFFRAHFGVERFANVLASKQKTERLFRWIRKTFNGDLFPLLPSEGRRLKRKHCKIVKRLLEGTSQTGQMRFWPYKFDVIPVELISSIYEMFTHSADGKTAKERSTHYTPINLVDLVLSEVFKVMPADGKILDMSCGSGVFLVESLRRLVSLRLAQGEELDRKLIQDTLYNQIFGIDISKEAIQIAAFSLYLTLLELDPNPKPPSALRFKPLAGRNLFAGEENNAFNEEADFNRQDPFASKGFAAIVGNPPWTRVAGDSLHAKYCKRHSYPVAKGCPPDQAFLWRVGDFASENTRIGLILHAKHFFSHQPEARTAKQALLTRFTPEVLMNLADLRQVKLFPTTVAPAMIFIGGARQVEPGDSFTFISLRRSEDFRNHGIIDISPENVKRLPTAKAASDPDMLKVASWGSARDMALIEKLRDLPGFLELDQLLKKWSWPKGRGIEPGGSFVATKQFPAKYLPSGEMPPYAFDARVLPNRERNLTLRRGQGRPQIYRGPLLIALRGLHQERFYSAVVDGDVLYTQLYVGFSATGEHPENRYLLNGIMNSSLTTYFLFMTASSWGVERPTVELVDLSRIPVPDPESVSPALLARVIKAERALARKALTGRISASLVEHLDNAVFRLYEIHDEGEEILIKDALNITIDLRRRRGDSHALKRPTREEMVAYCRQMIDVIRPLLATRNERGIIAEILDVGPSPLGVVNFRMVAAKAGGQSVRTVEVAALNDVLRRIEQQLETKIIDRVYSQRLLHVYAGDDLYVVKPAELRYWSRSAALNDADEILAQHLGAKRGIQ